ncbi:MAG: SMC-Scp complex subunit ScpB, partial [Thermoleophilia bacterium]|nr:SMC-Scp complex subunit ScpB [Thermoleophilia bacterium]
MEAALFVARQPLTPRKIAQICGFESTAEVRGYLRRLGKLYDEVGAAFCLVEVAGGFQLRTRPE